MSVLIVDDEPPARERLQRLIGELPGWTVAGCCASGAEALEEIDRTRPAIVLLDVRMPGMTGIETAQRLAALPRPPAVVFTTAYDEYALDAFDSEAVGYLLKPVRRERLLAALQHAARLGPPLGQSGGAPAEASETGGAAAPRRHVTVRVREGFRLIPTKDVHYFRADHKYVTVRHRGGEELIDDTLRSLEQEFAEDFVRVHRAYLVRVDDIEALERIDDGAYSLRLRPSGETLPVSRRQLTELKRRLGAAHAGRHGM
ncbi:MAG: response regulator transcription factor [Gammaproteobacteria bacterium]|nr:response regulator transcription factor [Gammaproteobacteria bacterium]